MTRWRIKFCMQRNELENQHSFTSEYQWGLLWEFPRNTGFSPENPSFWSMTPVKNTITRCRIKFCIQHNQLERQHSVTSEYQQGLLWKLPKNTGFSPENPSFWSMTPVKNTISRWRIKFCMQRNELENQHSFTSEYQWGLLWEFPRNTGFSPKNPSFCSMTPFKNSITRCRIKFCIQHNQLGNQHRFTSEYQQRLLWELPRNLGFSPANPSFCSMTPIRNTITRCKIKFCIQHNQLGNQHSFTSEYQQGLLWKLAENPGFSA